MGSLNFTFWNLGNFFDTQDDPISRDLDFTAERGWTKTVFNAKKKNLAQALTATHNSAGPELLAVCEIEKDELLAELIEEMGSSHLQVVLDPSGTSDLRGIDVALAFDKRKLAVEQARSHVVHLRFRTRDIFEVVLRLKETDETFVVIGSHWPSRKRGKYESEPARIAVAENIAFIVEDHVKVNPKTYETLRAQDRIAPIQKKWETKVLLAGDFNDEPGDRSVMDHLRASRDLDRVTGETNDIDKFKKETADYRAQEIFLYDAMSKFIGSPQTGTFFIDRLKSGAVFTNRYQILDHIVASRGLLSGKGLPPIAKGGLTLDLDSVSIFADPLVATKSRRPRNFDRKTLKGASDHLPVTAVLRW